MSAIDAADKIYANTDFSTIENILAEKGRSLILEKGMTLQPRPKEILVFTEGHLLVSNSSDVEGLAIGYVFKYFPIGLIESYFPLTDFYYKAESKVSLYQLTLEEYNAIFHAEDLRELSNKITAYMLTTLIITYYETNNDSGYATIRELLYRYHYRLSNSNIPEEPISKFILRRTRLSRSYVFQILSGLKTGGYITITNGKLVAINRDIPDRY